MTKPTLVQAVSTSNAQNDADRRLKIDRNDHMGAARAILKRYLTTDSQKHIHKRGESAWGWNGRSYEPARNGTLSGDIWRALERCDVEHLEIIKGKEYRNLVAYNPNRMLVANVIDAMLAQVPQYDGNRSPSWIGIADDMPPAGEVFPMANGILHVRTGKLYPHTPKLFNMWSSPVVFDPSAECPLWDYFVDSVHEGRKDCMDLHQEIFGYYLIASTFAQKFAIIQGIPGTGKSVVLKTLMGILGSGFVQMRMEQFGSRDTHAMAPAEGRAVLGVFDARIGPEMNNNALITALILLATGDGVPVRRNLTAGGDSHVDTYAKPIMATNKILRMPDAAIVPRIVLMSMNKVFRHTDAMIPELELKLRVELPGIVNWAVRGAQRLMERGHFDQPEYGSGVLQLTAERADAFGVFIENFLDIDPAGVVAREDLVLVFNKMHRKEHDLKREITGANLIEQLVAALGEGVVKRHRERTRYTNLEGVKGQGTKFSGVRIKPEVEQEFKARFGDRSARKSLSAD